MSLDANKFFSNPDKIAQFAHKKIKDSIDTAVTSDYRTLFQLKNLQQNWIVRLSYSLLTNLDAFNSLERIKKSPESVENILQAKLEHISPKLLSAKLSIKGVDETTSANIRSIFFGGEYKDENGGVVMFNAKSGYQKDKMLEVANELRDYFVELYHKEFGDE